jgi:cell division protein FtsW
MITVRPTRGALRRSKPVGNRRAAPRTADRERVKAAPAASPALPLGILAVVGALTLLGLVMVLSASSVAALDEYGSSWHYFNRQLMWVALGSVALVLAMRVDYHRWAALSRPILGVCLALLVLVLVPGVGVNVNGSSRWLGAGPAQIQPAEFAKFGVLVFVADLLARRSHLLHNSSRTMRPVLVVTGAVAVLLLAQPNLGTTLVIAAIVGSILLAVGMPINRLLGWGILGAMLATYAAMGTGYRRARVLAFLNPWDDPLNTGYQTIQSLVGVVTGGVAGVGLGASRAKWRFLPFAHTDFIFAIIGEELGLIGSLGVTALFVALGALGLRTALKAPDRFGTLLATGITTWLVVQAFVNIGAVIGILPITGVPLPFVSFGGSSMLALMGATGVLLNIARQAAGTR